MNALASGTTGFPPRFTGAREAHACGGCSAPVASVARFVAALLVDLRASIGTIAALYCRRSRRPVAIPPRARLHARHAAHHAAACARAALLSRIIGKYDH